MKKFKMNLPITREQAIELLKKYNSDISDWNHFLESEVIMRELAKKLGENEEYWGMLGLLHDIDWGITKQKPGEHLTKAPAILREAGFDEKFVEIVVSHGYGFDCAGLLEKKRTKKEEFALASSETISGLIHAYALMRKGIKGMDAAGLKKKFKDKRFASGVNRDIILEIKNVGISLEEFFEISIRAVEKIGDEVGLA